MTAQNIGPKQIEAFRRFFAKLPHGADFTLVILRGHLLLEEQVRAVVDERLVTPQSLLDARLQCHQVICLAEALCTKEVAPEIWIAAKKLNKLRNNIAHKLEHGNFETQVGNS